MATFADRVIKFNKELAFSTPLYKGIQIMNPFKANSEIISIIEALGLPEFLLRTLKD